MCKECRTHCFCHLFENGKESNNGSAEQNHLNILVKHDSFIVFFPVLLPHLIAFTASLFAPIYQ